MAPENQCTCRIRRTEEERSQIRQASHFPPHARLSTTKHWGSNPSTGPIVPVAVSLAEDQKSIDGQTSFKDAEYNIIDRDYERAKDDTAETLAEARSRLYRKRVWNQATSTSLTSQASEHVLTVGENTGVDDQANTLRGICSGSNHSEGVEPLEYFIYSSSISSNLTSFVAKAELQIIHDMKSDEFWTFVEAPDVEDDWDLISEVNRLRNAFSQPTFNTLLRERLEALRFQRESMKRKNSEIHQSTLREETGVHCTIWIDLFQSNRAQAQACLNLREKYGSAIAVVEKLW
ncbi:hypothetical protein OIDMADRAFT_24178 [Oidiodendron maius Zn]|uniref:Uncharacterized protein n=1 Tax=Oidiodendron maius (strain Zn) TaxID=913774 RepID=A0A0C3D3F5_OIDMZ|nr:hypothetical protein OIDMADRAFT_24178 [Oidiodendron maius Zn]